MSLRRVFLKVLAGIPILVGLCCAGAHAAQPGSSWEHADDQHWAALRTAFEVDGQARAALLAAVDQSIAWFKKPGADKFYPVSGISFAQAQLSVLELRKLLLGAGGEAQYEAARKAFDLLLYAPRKDGPNVMATAYCAPRYRASRLPTEEFRWPLYRVSTALIYDKAVDVASIRSGAAVRPFPTRRQIEVDGLLRGHEIAYLADPLDAYLVQVNGSAVLELTDGESLHLEFAGSNGWPYRSLGKMLVEDGVAQEGNVTMGLIRDYFKAHPERLNAYLHRNERYVFFREARSEGWPQGSLGGQLTPMRSIATDPRIYPPGMAAVLGLEQGAAVQAGAQHVEPLLVLNQDQGSAIKGARRVDLYVGAGPEAEALAGRLVRDGKLYFLVLKQSVGG